MTGSPTVRPAVVLATCCLSLFLVTMDITIVNVALPAIGRDFGTTIGGLQWAIDGYTVVLASFLVLGGSVADRFGRRRVFQLGLSLFGLGSLACSFAPTIEALVGCRVLQALGGAMLNPVALSIIVNLFVEPAQRARAIGVWGAVHGVSMALGPIIGGALVDGIGWRAVFWINLPVVIAAIALTRRFVPESRAERPRGFDPVGQVLVVIALAALTASLIECRGSGAAGWPLAGAAIAAVAVGWLVSYERRHRQPLIDPRFFRSVPFSAAIVIAIATFAMFNGGLFVISLYLQHTRGLSAMAAGLCLVPIAVALIACSPMSGRMVAVGRVRHALLAASCGLAGGAALLAELDAATPLPRLIAAFALLGAGLGFVNAPITTAAVSGMPREQAGVAAALASTSRQVGATLGVAIAGAITGSPHMPAFATASRTWWCAIIAGCVAVATVAVIATGERARRSLSSVHGRAP